MIDHSKTHRDAGERAPSTQEIGDGICYIVGAGDNYGIDFVPREEDCVIAADGGFLYLEEANIAADLVIGDFDTLRCPPDHPHVIVLNSEKDDTDTLAAVREGIRLGYRRFCFYACSGGRIEHTLAMIQVLAFLAQNDRRGFLIDRDSIMTAVTNEHIGFRPHEDGFVSVFSLSDHSRGVFLKGLKYELDDADLTNAFPLGVSNEFAGKQSSVAVREGTLLVVFPRIYREDLLP